jgi:hypothetical protein
MDVLYFGVRNPLKVMVSGVPAGNLELEPLSGGLQLSGKEGDYRIKPLEIGLAEIRVLNNRNHRVIDTIKINVVPLPDPEITFHLSPVMNLIPDHIIVHSDIWDQLGLRYSITKFELAAYRDTTALFSLVNESAAYTARTLKEINLLHFGDRLFIHQVWINVEGSEVSYQSRAGYRIQ